MPRPRWRRRLHHAGWGTLALIVLLSALLAWLVYTVSGRDTLLARVLAALPAHSLSWERADGVIGGPLTLYGVHYHYKGVEFRARRMRFDAALRPLLSRRLRLHALAVDDATLDLPRSIRQPLPTWPGSLPGFAVPFDLGIAQMHVRRLRISREHKPLIAIARLDGGLDLAPGRFTAHALRFDSDRGQGSLEARIDVTHNYHVRLLAQATLPPAHADGVPATVRVLAGGDMDRFVASLSGNAPGPLALRIDLRNGRATPRWTLALRAPRIDPALLLGGEPASPPYAIAFDLVGDGGTARAQGRIAQGGRAIAIAPSQLGYERGVLSAQPLALRLLDGGLRASGRVDLRPAAPVLDARIQLQGLRWHGPAASSGLPQPAVRADGELVVKGTLDAWNVQGALDFARAKQAAHVSLQGVGDRAQIRFDAFKARTPAGALDATGRLRWSPGLAWQLDATLDRFDPGYFAPGYDGAVSGHLRTLGARNADGWLDASASLETVSGQLRGRRLGGRAALDWRAAKAGGVGHVDADLNLGASHLIAKGAFGRTLDLALRFAPLHLDDAWANAAGTLAGTLTLRGEAAAPSIAGTLDGQSLRWGDYRAQTLHLDGSLPAHGNDGAIALAAHGVVGLAGIDALELHLAGSFATLRASGNASGSLGHLAMAGEARQLANAWNGRIGTLHYAPPQGAAWTLAAPATFRFGSGRLQLDHACLDAVGGGSLCAAADWPHTATITGRGLPLALVEPWLQQPDFSPHAYGLFDLDAHLAAAQGGGWSGQARLHSAQGGLRLDAQRERDLFGYTNLSADIALDGQRLQLRIDSALSAGGTLQAQASMGLAADAALSGTVQVDLHDLTWLELFSADLAAPKGRAVAHLVLGGTRAHPQLSGTGNLADFEGELPALGLRLSQGKLQLTAATNGDTQLSGSLQSGEGALAIDGRLRWNDPSAPLQVNLHGRNVRISNTPELVAKASPDLQLAYADGVLTLRGKVDVPSASIDLERLDTTVSPSPDVVVLDPAEPGRGHALMVDTDLALTLGDDVKLKGFGLDGKLGGALRVRQPPGREALATGNLDVSGRYRAYGQQLQIERGRLGYVNSAIDNPSLDVLAQRQFDEATVGVRVRGTALVPQTQIVSTPAMDSSEALAYLVLGHPLRSATGEESRQIGAAALALSAGGNLLAQKVGARLGLDESGVSQSRALGSAAFTVGKYLSPRLFVSYGVSLVGTGEVLTLKYLLRHGLDIQVESGRENRASLNWRKEK